MVTFSLELSSGTRQVLEDNLYRISTSSSLQRFWERVLTPQDRCRLGDDLMAALPNFRAPRVVTMWMALRGVSQARAVVEVAHALNFLTDQDHNWLLRELGEWSDDPEVAISRAVADGGLVLVERPRAAYWQENKINIDWKTQNAMWDTLMIFADSAKAGRPVDSMSFGEDAEQDVVSKRKSRLTNMKEFPPSLAILFEVSGLGTQRLNIPSQQIRIFEIESIDVLRERTA